MDSDDDSDVTIGTRVEFDGPLDDEDEAEADAEPILKGDVVFDDEDEPDAVLDDEDEPDAALDDEDEPDFPLSDGARRKLGAALALKDAAGTTGALTSTETLLGALVAARDAASAGSGRALVDSLPEPALEHLRDATRVLGVRDWPTDSDRLDGRASGIVATASVIANDTTGPGPIRSRHLVAAAVVGDLDEQALLSLGRTQNDLRDTMRSYLRSRWPEESPDRWDEILVPIPPDPAGGFVAEWPLATTNWQVVELVDASGGRGLGQQLSGGVVLTSDVAFDSEVTFLYVIDPATRDERAATVLARIDAGEGRGLLVLDVEGTTESSTATNLGLASPGQHVFSIIQWNTPEMVLGHGVVTIATADELVVKWDESTSSVPVSVGAPILAGDAVVGIILDWTVDAGVVSAPLTAFAEQLEPWLPQLTSLVASDGGATRDDHPLGTLFTPRAIDALTEAAGLSSRVRIDRVHMEHLVLALATIQGGSLQRLMTALPVTNDDLRGMIVENDGVVPPAATPTAPPALTGMPEMSSHVTSAVAAARRLAEARHEALVDEPHLVYGVLSITNCKLVDAMTRRGFRRDRLSISPPSRSEVAALRADTALGPDLLGLEREVSALASVLAAKDVAPPLSVGLFGDWGSGKSFFMRELELAIKGLEEQAQSDPDSLFCEKVVQLWFNAWHYMDADLWANLTASIFEGLARAIDEQATTIAGAAGEASVKDQLLAAAAHTRDALGEAERDRNEAKQQLETSQQLLKTINDESEAIAEGFTDRALLTAAAAAVVRLPEFQAAITDAGKKLHLDEAELAQQQVREALIEVRSVLDWLRFSWRKPRLRRRIMMFCLLVIVVAASYFALRPHFDQIGNSVMAVCGLVVAIGPVLKYVSSTRKALQQLEPVQSEARKTQRVQLEHARDSNARRLALAEKAVETHKLELANYQQRILALRADKKVSDFVRSRHASQDYTRHFGTVARARDDFTRLATFLADLKANPPTGEDGKAVPFAHVDRIVLYIDDLDRCPENKVVDVLQAVHLLLALPLFVVVVGVDSRWLLHSLRQHSKLFTEDDDESVDDAIDDDERVHWQSTPLNYLEKIFQIPFTLRPLESGGFESLIDDLATTATNTAKTGTTTASTTTTRQTGPSPTTPAGQPRATQATPDVGTPPSPPASEESATGAATPNTVDDQSSVAANPQQATTQAGSRLVPIRPQFLQIEPWERQMMKSIYGFIPSPRAAKRFVNVYRLLRATLTEEDYADFVRKDDGDYRIVLLLLAMQTSDPTTSTAILRDLLQSNDDQPWWTFVKGYRERYPIEPAEVDGEQSATDRLAEDRWRALLANLDDVQRRHPAMGSTVQFRRWARDVARYSFQSGRVLAERQTSVSQPAVANTNAPA